MLDMFVAFSYALKKPTSKSIGGARRSSLSFRMTGTHVFFEV